MANKTFSPGGSLPENKISFAVENIDGGECSFTLPRRSYLARGHVKKIDAWGVKNPKATTAELFVQIVYLFDKDAGKFLDADNIEIQQLESMWKHYEANEKVSLGESEASSDS